jgi:hypothetical protein
MDSNFCGSLYSDILKSVKAHMSRNLIVIEFNNAWFIPLN